MERTVALKKLRRLLGQKVGYRIDHKAPTEDDRAQARAEMPGAVERRNELREKRDARYKAILATDGEYQTLQASVQAVNKRVDELRGVAMHHKITVGTSEGMFFVVKAQGDSWEDVIDKLTAPPKKPEPAAPVPEQDRKAASASIVPVKN